MEWLAALLRPPPAPPPLPRGPCRPPPLPLGVPQRKHSAARPKHGNAPHEPHVQSPGRLLARPPRPATPSSSTSPRPPFPPPPPRAWPATPPSPLPLPPPPPPLPPPRRLRTRRSNASKRCASDGESPLRPLPCWRPPPGMADGAARGGRCAEWWLRKRRDAAARRRATLASARWRLRRRCHEGSPSRCAVAPRGRRDAPSAEGAGHGEASARRRRRAARVVGCTQAAARWVRAHQVTEGNSGSSAAQRRTETPHVPSAATQAPTDHNC